MINEASKVLNREDTLRANSIFLAYQDYLFEKEDQKISTHEVLSEILGTNIDDESLITKHLQTMLREDSDSAISLEEIKSFYGELNSKLENESDFTAVDLVRLSPSGKQLNTLVTNFDDRGREGNPHMTESEIENVLSDKKNHLLFNDFFTKKSHDQHDLEYFNLSMVECSDRTMSGLREILPAEFKAENDKLYPESAVQAASFKGHGEMKKPGQRQTEKRDLVGDYSHYLNILKEVEHSRKKELIEEDLRKSNLSREFKPGSGAGNIYTFIVMALEKYEKKTMRQMVINRHNKVKPKFKDKQLDKDFKNVEKTIVKVNKYLNYIDKNPDSEQSQTYRDSIRAFDLSEINKGIGNCVTNSEAVANSDASKTDVELRLNKLFKDHGDLDARIEKSADPEIKALGAEFAADFKKTMDSIGNVMASAIEKVKRLIAGNHDKNADQETHLTPQP
jgi:cupin superfamily acireductone dioxygenase involved in methionine salvage